MFTVNRVKPAGCALAAMAACVGAIFAGCADRPADPSQLLTTAKSFDRHRAYHLGTSFEGLPLTAAPDARGGPAGGNPGVDFVYGTCDPGGGLFADGGCAPPLSVQTWSACERSIAGLDVPYRRMTVRGVPAAAVDGDTRLEVQTGDVTVVVFATTRHLAWRAAHGLRSLDGRIAPRQELPAPVAGALAGRPAGCG